MRTGIAQRHAGVRIAGDHIHSVVRRVARAAQIAALAKRTPAPASASLRALKSSIPKPPASQPASRPLMTTEETPTDAQFLESFEEM